VAAVTRISTADAALLYRIPARTLRRWHAEGRITVHREGRNLWWNLDELDQLAGQRGEGRLPRTPVMAHAL
jgi:predicted site-specific integrase-resolvase